MDSTKVEIFGSNYFLPQNVWISLLVLAGAVIVGLLIYGIIVFIYTRIQKRKEISERILTLQLSHLKPPLRSLLPAFIVFFVLPGVWFPKEYKYIIVHIVDFWLIISLAWMFIKVVVAARVIMLSKYQWEGTGNLKARRVHTQFRIIERVIKAIIVLIAISAYLMTFEKVREVGVSILASAGIIGIIIGFAAQKTLGQLFAGVLIAFSQPIRLDDVVIVEGEWGRIEEITLTYVVVRIWDLRRLIVPITYFLEKPFQNWTRSSSEIIGSVYIYSDYTVPVEKIREKFLSLLESNDKWNKKTAGMVVLNLTEKTVEIRGIMSADDSGAAFDLRCYIREKLLEYLQENFPASLPKTRIEIDKQRE